MLKPRVETRVEDGQMFAEFWDCYRLDVAPVQDLRDQFEAHRKSQGRPHLILNMSGVTFAGSTVLGLFLQMYRSAKPSGGRIALYNVDHNVREVFRASRLDPFFEFTESHEQAVEQLKGPPPELGRASGSAGPTSTPLRRIKRDKPDTP